MRKDKHIAEALRKEGKSYRQIEAQLGVSRATLCAWFSKKPWSERVMLSNAAKASLKDPEKMKKMQKARKAKLDAQYDWAKIEAERDYERYIIDPLFMAGLMLYAGEGDKLTDGQVRICNSEAYILRIFMNFLKTCAEIDPKRIRASVLGYPDLDIEEIESYWSKQLGLPRGQFHKTQIIQGKPSRRRLRFGVASIIVSDKFFKIKLMEMIHLAEIKLDAAII